MNRCPKCNNALSSSDVLCPKCGAMVEEINTKVSVNSKFADKPISSNSESATMPDHYENIIMYNESFSMREPEPPAAPEEPDTFEEPEDFDIENIISANGDSHHVNPLLAHIEKQRNNTLNQEQPEQDEEADEVIEPAEELIPEPKEDAEEITDMIPEEDNESWNDEEDTVSDEGLDIEPEVSAKPVALNELEQIAKELTAPPKKEEDNFPIDGMPSYSKSYLEAINSIEISDEELDDVEFDPNAYMEQYKRSKQDETDVKEQDAYIIEEPEPKVEEPIRRRYNPNKPKPKYDEDELRKQYNPDATPTEEQDKPVLSSDQQDKPDTTPTEEQASLVSELEQNEPETIKEETTSNTPKEQDDVLEMELDPSKFFVQEAGDEQDKDEEHFLVDQEDEVQVIRNTIAAKDNYVFEDTKREDTILDKVDSSANYSPEEKRNKLPVWAAVLIWLAIAGGVFFGAYTFDKHVNETYNSYNDYIYEISDGKIDIKSMLK